MVALIIINQCLHGWVCARVCAASARETWMTMCSHILTVFAYQRSLIIPCQQLRGLFVSLQTHLLPPSITTAARRSPFFPVFFLSQSVGLWHARRARGSSQLSKTITAAHAALRRRRDLNPDSDGRRENGIEGWARKKFIMDANQFAAVPFVPRRHACTAWV